MIYQSNVSQTVGNNALTTKLKSHLNIHGSTTVKLYQKRNLCLLIICFIIILDSYTFKSINHYKKNHTLQL